MPSDLRFREFNPLKIWHHADRLAALAAGRDVVPVTVEVDPVAYCNHRCAWCVDPAHWPVAASRDFLWTLLAELATFQVNGFDVHGIVFKGGGEPTLHPDFPELVQYACALGFEVGVVTNGSRLLACGMAEALADSASYVRISIDGPTAETHRAHSRQPRLRGDHGRRAAPGIPAPGAPPDHRPQLCDGPPADPGDPRGHRPGRATEGGLRIDPLTLLRGGWPPSHDDRRPGRGVAAGAGCCRQMLPGPMDILVGAWIGDAERTAQTGENGGLDASGRRDLQLARTCPSSTGLVSAGRRRSWRW